MSKIAFVDIETTGLNFLRDEVIEIGIAIADSLTEKITEEHNFFMEATRGINPEAARVNGYHVGKWGSKAGNPYKIALEVNRILKNADNIYAHNAAFDRSFLSAFLSTHGVGVRDQPKYFLDTVTLANLFRDAKYFDRVSLDECLDKLNMSNLRSQKHGALEDARLLKEVYFKLIKKIQIKWNN